ncbi:hypothetical protein BRC74_03540 [Halobacteriales archaeon QH_7_68_42]|nr:MAG: hypothetical protein BRC74_03540 [Halobacteriales archaeon QH_7_68_42]
MQEAWIQLQCPGCEEQREANPADLPGPQATRTCDSCGETRPTSEFTRTVRDFEILESFHAA